MNPDLQETLRALADAVRRAAHATQDDYTLAPPRPQEPPR